MCLCVCKVNNINLYVSFSHIFKLFQVKKKSKHKSVRQMNKYELEKEMSNKYAISS